MSYILPNGVHIYLANPSIEALEHIHGMIMRRESILVTSVDFDGVETTTTLWHPDDPLMDFERLARGYQPPPGRLTTVWCRFKAWLSSSNA